MMAPRYWELSVLATKMAVGPSAADVYKRQHTEGGDFRQATYRAVRQGLMMADQIHKTQLLEPWRCV